MKLFSKNVNLALQMLVLTALVVLALFLWQGNKGLNLADEGFLWYGAQRVMVGEVPIRDFMAYDPGRYYWSAGFMRLCGSNGIMALRGAVAFFQVLGLLAGVYILSKLIQSKWQRPFLSVVFALTIAVWMFPRHKIFDASLSLLLIYLLTFLIESPTKLRYFLTGLSIGLVSIFGRNHGVYGVAGGLGVMVWLNFKSANVPRVIKNFLYWAFGITVGTMPMLFLILATPGFASAFWRSIRFLFEIKATNLPLPVPWPWSVHYSALPFAESIRQGSIGLLFIGIVAFGALALFWVFRQKFFGKQVPSVLVSSAFLMFPYAQFAYSRAEIGHLALGIFPLVVGLFAIAASQSTRIRWGLALTIFVASLWLTSAYQPGWQCLTSHQWVTVEISGSQLKLDPETAGNVNLLRSLSAKYTPNGQNFLVAPFWPGAYPLLERKSPMWEVYALFHHPKVFEQTEVERIKAAKPSFAFILDVPLDGREDLRFRNTHPLIQQYLTDNFMLVPESSNPAFQIYTPKASAP